MKAKVYTCERYKSLNIGSTKEREVKFRNGLFTATQPWQVKMIEENEWYNCFIFPRDPPVADDPPPPPPPKTDDPPPPPPVKLSEYVISKTAKEILEGADISIEMAAGRLELMDGDTITVKMARGLVK